MTIQTAPFEPSELLQLLQAAGASLNEAIAMAEAWANAPRPLDPEIQAIVDSYPNPSIADVTAMMEQAEEIGRRRSLG